MKMINTKTSIQNKVLLPVKTFFGNIKEKRKNSEKKGRAKEFFSQLSRGLMLPVAILPIAGLLLGISGAIGANDSSEAGQIASNILNGMSNVVFTILPLLFCIALTITFSKDRGASGFCSALAYLVFCSFQIAFFQYNDKSELVSIMWFHNDPILLSSIVTGSLGYTTLQTSVFGGIVVGLITSVVYNKVSKIQLPKVLDFFSGIRLVPIVLIPVISLLTLLFLIFWPWVGQVINLIGGGIQQAPSGSGGLLYGILGRALMPFGLHHIPIILAFQTPFGGNLELKALTDALSKNGESQTTINTIVSAFGSGTSISGDQNIWNYINGLPYNELLLNGQKTPIFEWFTKELGVYPGRYTQDYPTYLGACMGIGAAIIVTSKKENRKRVSSVIVSSMFVAFLTGITEPLEFTFLFCAPLLYYIIYVPMSGFSYMFMELAGAHVGVGFARGFIDLIIYGAIPVAKGTNFFYAFPLALAEGLVTFFLFWILIKKLNIETPGRGENNFELINKKTYQELKGKNKDQKNGVDKRTIDVIKCLGGLGNIQTVSACATRLRVNLLEPEKLDIKKAKELGSMGEIVKNKSAQLIFGGEATILSEKINNIIDENIDIDYYVNDSENETNNEAKDQKSERVNKQPFKVYAPVDCEVVSLKNVNDDAFKNKLLGDGIAIIPKSANLFSILEKGELSNVFDTKHCYIFKTPDGTSVMMHIGIDSVNLKGVPFELKSKVNDKVDLKKNIVKLDLEKLKKCKSVHTPIVICEPDENRVIKQLVKDKQIVKKGTPLLEITYKK
ncbi:MAG: glucose PTS transporter subunit IIA [Malacoplasma sp.]|nr:glucose PTS transporter subunit IIA [Malacoplasma sp.]